MRCGRCSSRTVGDHAQSVAHPSDDLADALGGVRRRQGLPRTAGSSPVQPTAAILDAPSWFSANYPQEAGQLGPVAYFSMEFGLGEALPIYSGGLGILAGDLLKTASDLGIPVVGVGLLWQQGYFRQALDPAATR